MARWLGIDIGQTFTDLLLVDAGSGAYLGRQVRSDPEDPVASVRDGVAALLQADGLAAADIQTVCHALPYTRDHLPAQQGPAIGLLLTAGFEDVLLLGTGETAGPFYGWHRQSDGTAPVARKRTRGISQRITAAGDIVQPLDEDQVRAAAHDLLIAGAERIVVSLLHSLSNPSHEQRVSEIIAGALPHIPVFSAVTLSAEADYHARTLSAVYDVALRTAREHYSDHLNSVLGALQISAPVHMARSDGGLVPAGVQDPSPLQLLEGGVAATVIAARTIAEKAGLNHALVLAMGGRSGHVSVLKNARPRRQDRLRVAVGHGQSRLTFPGIDTEKVNAGVLSKSGLPVPGGAAQNTPTLLDAMVVLGRMPMEPTGKALAIESETALLRVKQQASALGWDTYETAQAIVALAEEEMAARCHVIAADQGCQVHQMALIAAGGAGPMHAVGVAARLSSWPVIVPPAPAHMATQGLLAANPRETFVRKLGGQALDTMDPDDFLDHCRRLGEKADNWLRQARVNNGRLKYEIGLRIAGETPEHTHSFDPKAIKTAGFDSLVQDFHTWHAGRFEQALSATIEVVFVQVVVSGAASGLSLNPSAPAGRTARDAVLDELQIYFDGGFTTCKRYERAKLGPNQQFSGPALIADTGTTIVVPPGHAVTVDPAYNLVVNPVA